MQRSISFYIPRANHLKVVSPVIKYILGNHAGSFSISVFLAGWNISKPWLQLGEKDIATLFGRQVNVVTLESPQALLPAIKKHNVQAVINVTPRLTEIDESSAAEIMTKSRGYGTRWIALPHVYEEIYFLVQDPERILSNWDLICTLGPRAVEWAEATLGSASDILLNTLRKKLIVTGYPELDALSTYNRAGILQKYGLPENKPVIYISTAPDFSDGYRKLACVGLSGRFRDNGKINRHSLIKFATYGRYPVLIPYRRYLSALRTFADANGACLIAKTRDKHKDPGYIHDYIDHVFGDETYFPFTTLELLSISSLYFGFHSASIIEALAAGVYSLTAVFLPLNTVTSPSFHRELTKFIYYNPQSLWNLDGLSETINGTGLSGYSALRALANSRLKDYTIDPRRKELLLDKFISYRGRSSEVFTDALSSLWKV